MTRSATREAVTLMEVIFAIGVILTGLVGLAALIPIAVDNAAATIELDRGISESVSAAATAAAQEFDSVDELVIYYKDVQGSPAIPAPPSNGSGQGQAVDLGTVLAAIDDLNSPGYHHTDRINGLAAGVCIDPLGMPNIDLDTSYVANAADLSRDTYYPFRTPDASDSAFDASRFPYFNERYGVVAPPNAAVGSPGSVGLGGTNTWPMGPRMYRATLQSDFIDPTVTTLRQSNLINPAASKRIFTSSGGVASIAGNHKGDPDSLQNVSTVVGGVSFDSSFVRASRYSWMVTLSPPLFGGDLFRQSVVIIKDRIAAVPRRLNDVLALQKTSFSIEDADDNPQAERLTWVSNWTGFSGGGGGDIQIVGSQAFDNEVVSGQWIMLSRQPHIAGGGPLQAIGPAVHRWFKILRVEQPEILPSLNFGNVSAETNWPHGATPAWSRWLSLSGPDWTFQSEGPPSTNTTAIDDTFCTIVAGAVSVIESDVRLQR